MPRTARITVPGVPHHICHRGNNRQKIFHDEKERYVYLSFLRENSEKYGLAILAYCLMENHVHVIAIPRNDESLSKGMGRTAFRYTMYINQSHGFCGHLWQARFHSCPMGETHFYHAARYVERNPMRAGFAGSPWEYEWSSALAHVSGKDRQGLLDEEAWPEGWTGDSWKEELTRPCSGEFLAEVREASRGGHPLGLQT